MKCHQLMKQPCKTKHLDIQKPKEKKQKILLLKISSIQRINKDTRYRAAFVTALDDKYFNGGKAEISISGVNETLLSDDESDYFVKGDTILVKLCTMDEPSFEFWNSFQEEMVNTNNPFAASLAEVRSNVEEDGLGIWSGYGVSVKEIILKQVFIQ